MDVQAYHLIFQDVGEHSASQSDQHVCRISVQAGSFSPLTKIIAAASDCSCFALTQLKMIQFKNVSAQVNSS